MIDSTLKTLRGELIGFPPRHLLASVTTWGGIGNVTNWQQHVIPLALDDPGKELAKILGDASQAAPELPRNYTGPARVIVPTLRSQVRAGESLTLKVLVLAEQQPSEAVLQWREMGSGEYERIGLRHVARGMYTVTLPSARGLAME